MAAVLLNGLARVPTYRREPLHVFLCAHGNALVETPTPSCDNRYREWGTMPLQARTETCAVPIANTAHLICSIIPTR